MAVSLGPTAPGRKRPLDAELNLVPFIDLLICCICFLLITAVWVQLSSVEVRSGGGPSEGVARPAPRLMLLVGNDGYTLSLGPERLVLGKQGRAYDESRLARELGTLRTSSPGTALVVAGEDGVPVRQVIRAVDIAHQASFTELTLSDSHGLL